MVWCAVAGWMCVLFLCAVRAFRNIYLGPVDQYVCIHTYMLECGDCCECSANAREATDKRVLRSILYTDERPAASACLWVPREMSGVHGCTRASTRASASHRRHWCAWLRRCCDASSSRGACIQQCRKVVVVVVARGFNDAAVAFRLVVLGTPRRFSVRE